MPRWLGLFLALCVLPSNAGHAVTALDPEFANKGVVFLYDSAGNVATGFLISVPKKNGQSFYPLIVTARHVVDPVWAGCGSENPTALSARVNNLRFDPLSGETGVSFIPIPLLQNGVPTWHKDDEDDNVDVAVLKAPDDLAAGRYDVGFTRFRNFGRTDEIAKIGVGSQIASTGIVPAIDGGKRNYPIFKFGKISNVPDEMAILKCKQDSKPRPLRIWWIAINLVPGTSGSPIYFDPMFPPGSDVTVGEPRVMIIGLQSLSLMGADLAGMTPVKYIIDVISHSVPDDADLSLGVPLK